MFLASDCFVFHMIYNSSEGSALFSIEPSVLTSISSPENLSFQQAKLRGDWLSSFYHDVWTFLDEVIVAWTLAPLNVGGRQIYVASRGHDRSLWKIFLVFQVFQVVPVSRIFRVIGDAEALLDGIGLGLDEQQTLGEVVLADHRTIADHVFLCRFQAWACELERSLNSQREFVGPSLRCRWCVPMHSLHLWSLWSRWSNILESCETSRRTPYEPSRWDRSGRRYREFHPLKFERAIQTLREHSRDPNKWGWVSFIKRKSNFELTTGELDPSFRRLSTTFSGVLLLWPFLPPSRPPPLRWGGERLRLYRNRSWDGGESECLLYFGGGGGDGIRCLLLKRVVFWLVPSWLLAYSATHLYLYAENDLDRERCWWLLKVNKRKQE